jgi:SAM-dependent methyltransferase
MNVKSPELSLALAPHPAEVRDRIDQFIESANNIRCEVSPIVLNEATELVEAGFDIKLEDIEDEYSSNWLKRKIGSAVLKTIGGVRKYSQAIADSNWEVQIGGYEIGQSTAHDAFNLLPAIRRWSSLVSNSTSAIPLVSFYDPEAAYLGCGIDPDVFERKDIFGDSVSARELRVKQLTNKTEKSDEIAGSEVKGYREFIGTRRDAISAILFHEVRDVKAVRTRAKAMTGLVKEHVAALEPEERKDLVSLSVGCGAAQPVFDMVQQIESEIDGAKFSNIQLVDNNPLTLAAAQSIAESRNLQERTELFAKNALRLGCIEKESVDVVDLIGLFEYFPPQAAKILLKEVKNLVKPGGLIVLGNMLVDRPDQDFFSNVVEWPELQQRSLEAVLDIVDDAGLNSSEAKIRLPSREGVYAVYALPVNKKPLDSGLEVAA